MKKLILFLLVPCLFSNVFAQKSFNGSFLMSFKTAESDRDYPLEWNIEKKSSGGKMGLEIHDELVIEGVLKRVIFNSSDSTWTMLIGFNSVKQGTRIHAAAMFKDSIRPEKINVTTTNEKRKIENYHCRKIVVETSKNIAEVWVTDQLPFDLCYVYKLLAHCGMLSKYVQRGDWYWTKNIKGMILEVTSRKKLSGETYTISISAIKPGYINSELFDTSGYKISDIPEGQNCGFVEED